jgi:hypothetical protein
MKKRSKSLEKLVKELPSEFQEEVRDFVEFLLGKQKKRSRGKPTLDWAGALADLRDQYTSMELQHRISKWRMGEE